MTFCSVPGCGQPAGTACTYALCPGLNRSNSRASLPAQAGGAAPLSGSPTPFLAFDHLLHAEGITA